MVRRIAAPYHSKRPFKKAKTSKRSYKKVLRKGPYGRRPSASASGSRTSYSKSRSVNKAPRTTLKSRLKAVEKLARVGITKQTVCERNLMQVTSPANQSTHTAIQFLNLSSLESATSDLQFHDIDLITGQGFTDVDIAARTTDINIKVTSVYVKALLRNNSLQPAEVDLYLVQPRGNTAKSGIAAFGEGVQDNPALYPANYTGASSVLTYLSDSTYFKKLYKITNKKKMWLEPGAQLEFSQAVDLPPNGFKYNPGFADTETSAYQRKLGAYQLIARVTGCLSHQAVDPTNLGIGEAFIDCCVDRYITFQYNGGVEAHHKVVLNADGVDTGLEATTMEIEQNVPSA